MKKLVVVFLLALIVLPGCKQYVPVYPKLIIIPRPGRPTYEKLEAKPPLTDNEKQLLKAAHAWQVYAKQLELGIDKYNEVADKHNKLYKKHFDDYKNDGKTKSKVKDKNGETRSGFDPGPISDDEFSY